MTETFPAEDVVLSEPVAAAAAVSAVSLRSTLKMMMAGQLGARQLLSKLSQKLSSLSRLHKLCYGAGAGLLLWYLLSKPKKDKFKKPYPVQPSRYEPI